MFLLKVSNLAVIPAGQKTIVLKVSNLAVIPAEPLLIEMWMKTGNMYMSNAHNSCKS